MNSEGLLTRMCHEIRISRLKSVTTGMEMVHFSGSEAIYLVEPANSLVFDFNRRFARNWLSY